MSHLKQEMCTLAYLERDGKYLMLHRVKKEHDINEGKWIGIGGHFEEAESPEECMIREAKEESGYDLRLSAEDFRGIVTFTCRQMDGSVDTEYMYLFNPKNFSGNCKICDEGNLAWIEKEKIFDLPIWTGDRIFLRLIMENHPFFSLKLEYEGDELIRAVLDGKEVSIDE